LRRRGLRETIRRRKCGRDHDLQKGANSNGRLANRLYTKGEFVEMFTRVSGTVFLTTSIVADLAAEEEDYPKAVENFEKVSKASIQNNLLKYSVRVLVRPLTQTLAKDFHR